MYALHWYETYTRSVQFKCFNFMLIILHTSSNKVFWLKISIEILFDWYFFFVDFEEATIPKIGSNRYFVIYFIFEIGEDPHFNLEALFFESILMLSKTEHVQYNLVGNEINIYFKCFRCQRVFCAK